MTDNDDILVRRFFDEQTKEIADHGFTKRVMRRIPGRAYRLNRLWTLLCAVLGVVFFVAVRGWETLLHALSVLFHTAPAQDVFQLSPLTLVLSLLVLTTVGAVRLATREW